MAKKTCRNNLIDLYQSQKSCNLLVQYDEPPKNCKGVPVFCRENATFKNGTKKAQTCQKQNTVLNTYLENKLPRL